MNVVDRRAAAAAPPRCRARSAGSRTRPSAELDAVQRTLAVRPRTGRSAAAARRCTRSPAPARPNARPGEPADRTAPRHPTAAAPGTDGARRGRGGTGHRLRAGRRTAADALIDEGLQRRRGQHGLRAPSSDAASMPIERVGDVLLGLGAITALRDLPALFPPAQRRWSCRARARHRRAACTPAAIPCRAGAAPLVERGETFGVAAAAVLGQRQAVDARGTSSG